MSKIDTLILTGGGMRDVSVIGALNVLEKKYILNNITKYAGSSSGAMICVLLNIGYTPLQIKESAFSQGTKMVFDNFFKVPFNLIFKYGLFSGDKMVKYINILFTEKQLSPNITFIELYEITKKTLVLTGTSLTQKRTFYFNHHTFPNMKVIDALRISISIPLYFTSIKYMIDNINHVFVDGGFLNNFPLYYFEITDDEKKYISNCSLLPDKYDCNVQPENIIGITIIGSNQISIQPTKINNIKDYLISFVNTLLNKIQAANLINPVNGSDAFLSRVILIYLPEDVSPIDFDMSKDMSNKLVDIGEKAAEVFFRNEFTDNKSTKSVLLNYIGWF